MLIEKTLYEKCKLSFLKNVKKFMPLHLLATACAAPFALYKLFNGGCGLLELLLNFFTNITLLWSWADIGTNLFNGVSWFLSTTLLFAALSPVIVKAISKIKRLRIVALLLACILAVQISLAFVCQSLLHDRWLIYVFPPVRLLDCISGCLIFKLAEAMKKHIHSLGSLLFLILFIGLGGGCYILTFFFAHQVFQTAVWSIPSWGIIAFLYLGDEKSKPIKQIFGNVLFQSMGAITFEFFLFHELCLLYLRGFYKIVFGREQDIILVLVAFILSIAWAAFLHYIISKLKKRKSNAIKAVEREETAADVPVETEDDND